MENKERLQIEAKRYYIENKEKISKRVAVWQSENREKFLRDKDTWRTKNKEKIAKQKKEYYKKNRESIRARAAEYEKRTAEKTRDRKRRYREENLDLCRQRDRRDAAIRRTNPSYKLHNNISRRIRATIGDAKAGQSVFEHLPYTPQILKDHIESQFEDWMKWENYGVISKERRTWHIDHIYPHSMLAYDSMQHPNFQKCWALENLRPLCALENVKKSNKIIKKGNKK